MPSLMCVVSQPTVFAGRDAQLAVSVQSRLASQYWYVIVSTPEAAAPPGSLWLELSDTVRRTAWAGFETAGSSIVAVGAVRSSSHVQLSGLSSMFPAASIARTSKVCVPSAGVGVTLCEPEHVFHEPPSSLHSKVPASLESKVKLGGSTFVGSPGLVWIVVSGSVRSTVTSAVALETWPNTSTASAFRAWCPSAGTGQEAVNGAALSVPSGSQLPVAQATLVSEQRKKST